MGIRVPPLPEPYGDDCLDCYDPDETPQILYAIFRDISAGAAWNPGDPAPPNSVFQLIQSDIAPCYWSYQGDRWRVIYTAINALLPHYHSGLNIESFVLPGWFAFGGYSPPKCVSRFDNLIVEPPNAKWVGGSGWLFTLTI